MRELLGLIAADPELPEPLRELAGAAGRTPVGEAGHPAVIRLVDDVRHGLLAALGMEPAEWDLIAGAGVRLDPRGAGPRTGAGERCAAGLLAGVGVFLDSVRSPFNVGNIIRSAAAFGVGSICLGPGCPRADHPRLIRSAMGANRAVRLVTAELEPFVASMRTDQEGGAGRSAPAAAHVPVVALELGGEPADSFEYPQEGVLVVGSEELGIRPEILTRADRRLSIPLPGVKASLNVGVACGIALHHWSSAIAALSSTAGS